MRYREATTDDITQLQQIRNSVKENILSNPALVTADHYKEYLTVRGKGWVCELEDFIVGFAIADLKESNIWALFLRPEFEGKGIGRHLQDLMLDWYFTHGKESVWLGTSRDTRAEIFYRKMGWRETGFHGKGEIKFEMTRAQWLNRRSSVCKIDGSQCRDVSL